MRFTIVAIALLTATIAFAQTAPKTEQEARAQLELIERNACPVGIAARQQGSPVAIWTTSLEDSSKPPTAIAKMHTGVHVDLAARTKAIKSVDLAVFYLPPGTRMLPVTGSQFAPSQNPAPEAHKNFSLAAGSASLRLDGDLLLGPVATITHVNLMHVSYADGSEWNAPVPGSSCSVKPSLFMPVHTK